MAVQVTGPTRLGTSKEVAKAFPIFGFHALYARGVGVPADGDLSQTRAPRAAIAGAISLTPVHRLNHECDYGAQGKDCTIGQRGLDEAKVWRRQARAHRWQCEREVARDKIRR